MKGMIYGTELRIDPPLLIDRKALESLHATINVTSDKIFRINDEALENEVEEEFQEFASYYKEKSPLEIEKKKKEIKAHRSWKYKKYKEIAAKLGENKSFSTETLKELILAPELSQQNIKELRIQYGAEKVSVLILIDSSALLIRTSPEDNDISKEIFIELRDWAYQNQAPLWQRLWNKIKGFHWMIFFLILFLFASFMQTLQTSQDVAMENHKVEAHKLLTRGITNNTLSQAVELVLKIQSKYVPESQKQEEQSLVKRFRVLLIVCLLIAIILSILPTLVIGTGKGYSKIIYWRWWLRAVSITIPSLIFTSILWPKIVAFITNFLNP